MEDDGIRCFNKLFHALIVVVILLPCVVNPSPYLGFNNISSGGVMRCIEREREALLAFKQGLVDDNNFLSSWGIEEHKQDCCKWVGVHCSNRTNHVIQLDLGLERYHRSRSFDQKGHPHDIRYHLQALPDEPCPKSFARSRLARLSPTRKQKPDSSPQPAPTSQGSCVLVGQEVIPDGNSCDEHIELQHLKYLDLSWINFNGIRLPDFIGSLSSLRYLDLFSASFGGQFPSQVGNLTHLQHLDLSFNHFANVVNLNSWLPHLSSLTYLDLSYNNLSNVPDWLETVSKLPKLTNLTLLNCSLPYPAIHSSTLFNINSSRSLAHVDLSSNELTSSIFRWLSKYNASLGHLDMSFNQLTGLFPDVIGNMSSLTYLDLFFNQFEGVISESHFSGLSRLRCFGLSSASLTLNFHSKWVPPFQLDFIFLGPCKMGPHFPNWLQTQRSYSVLDISTAGISDTLPSWFWERLSHHHEIDFVDLSNNQIKGTIPNSQIDFLYYPRFQLEGQVPPFLLKASSLDLSHNNFSGSFSFLFPMKASNLTLLDLSSNHLDGQLPDCWTHFKNLLILDLSDNHFSGRIPTTMGSLFSIRTLNLNNNGFVGELPSSLNNCSSLVVFYVANNNLSGPIPEWVGYGLPNLTILILRLNYFYGSIPLQMCNMRSIQILDFSMNNISGSIPKCLNNLTNLALRGSSSLTITRTIYVNSHTITGYSYDDEASFIWKGMMSKYKSILGLVKSIHLSSNRLTGEIPCEITDLVGLVSLNLSRNNLTGQITPNIGKMQSLDLLDLSNNQIHGTIPTSLFGISGLGMLDLSNNNLSGKIPIGSQLQIYEPSVFAGNPLLCGIPLQTCSSEETTPEEQPVVGNQDEDNDGFITPGFYVSLGLGFVVGFWGVCGSSIFNRLWRYTYFKLLNGLNDWLYVGVTLFRQQRMLDE